MRSSSSSSSTTSKCTAQPLIWGEPLPPNLVNCVDIVIASDVVYDPEGYAPLVHTLALLLQPQSQSSLQQSIQQSVQEQQSVQQSQQQQEQQSVQQCHTAKYCLLAHRSRHPQEKAFFLLLAEAGMVMTRIPTTTTTTTTTTLDASSSSSSRQKQLDDVQLYMVFFPEESSKDCV